MFDHLAEGRFIFGISPGALRSRRRGARHPGPGPQQDVRRGDRRDPRDLGARSALRHRVSRQPLQGDDAQDPAPRASARGVMHKPYQKPRPEIVGTVVAPYSKGVIAHGRARLPPAVGELPAAELAAQSHWANYAEGKRKAGMDADPADWRIARTIFVADDDKIAAAYGRDDPQQSLSLLLQAAPDQADRWRSATWCSRSATDQPDAELTPRLRARPARASTAR